MLYRVAIEHLVEEYHVAQKVIFEHVITQSIPPTKFQTGRSRPLFLNYLLCIDRGQSLSMVHLDNRNKCIFFCICQPLVFRNPWFHKFAFLRIWLQRIGFCSMRLGIGRNTCHNSIGHSVHDLHNLHSNDFLVAFLSNLFCAPCFALCISDKF